MLRLRRLEQTMDRCPAEELETSCQSYFSRYCGRLSCFDELRDVVDSLDARRQQDFIHFTQDHAEQGPEASVSRGIRTLNALKLEYCYAISPAGSATTSQNFACKAIDIYKQSCSHEGESGVAIAQTAMLACMALLRSGEAESEDKHAQANRHIARLQSGFLLRHCLERSKDDHTTLVVLTYLSTLLGAISISAVCFGKLSIKNLQWESAGHLLLSRLSTLHPLKFKGGDGARLDPLHKLQHAIGIKKHFLASVTEHVMAGLNQRSYVNVLETIEFKEDLKRSYSESLFQVEYARTTRLRDLTDSNRDKISAGKNSGCALILEPW
jgi:N-terminal acetyltransferase B complex non-catalytic subunit